MVHPDSQPYITFYMEGWSYFAYQRMPFGVTGGPSEFGHVTAQHFHDLIVGAVLELFVDDGAMCSDSFVEGLDKLRTLLKRVREGEDVFIARQASLVHDRSGVCWCQVSLLRVTLDTAKLTAIID